MFKTGYCSLRLVVFMVILFQGILTSQELRQCNNIDCKKYALSETWAFCPYCGTELSLSSTSQISKRISKDIIIGNIYKDSKYNFQIEKPSEIWKFKEKGKGLGELNEDAEIGMFTEDGVFNIVIAERMGDVDLSDYADLVAPELNDRIRVYEKSIKLGGLDALKTKWIGTVSNITIHFYFTIVQDSPMNYQIVSWCLPDMDNETTQAQIIAIEESFKILRDGTGLGVDKIE